MRFVHYLFPLACIALVACGDDGDGSLKSGAPGKSTSSSGTDTNGTTDPSSSGGASGGSADGNGSTADAGAGSANPTGGGGASTPEQICVDQINAYRKTVGSPALTRWTAEESCADGQAKSDSSSNSAHGAFGMCSEMGQNECPGWPGPAGDMIPSCLKAMWGEGPGGGHYENMKATRYTQVSCGFYTLADGSVWAVQNFR